MQQTYHLNTSFFLLRPDPQKIFAGFRGEGYFIYEQTIY